MRRSEQVVQTKASAVRVVGATIRAWSVAEVVMPRTAVAMTVLALIAVVGGSYGCSRSEDSAAVQNARSGGRHPAILVTQAQFREQKNADGKTVSIPGPAKLTIVRKTDSGWKSVTLEDPDSNVFHKALPYDGGILTIGGDRAMLKVWRFAGSQWQQETHWNPKFGGKFDRLRDVEEGDVDGDGKNEFVIATHDQGVIAVVHPDEDWRVEEVNREPNRFAHEIEIGDIDGDGRAEFFVTVSQPNTLDKPQPGDIRLYRYDAGRWGKTLVEAGEDTHAKEILAVDADRDGRTKLFGAWEAALDAQGKVVRPVTVKQYRWANGGFETSTVATLPDRQLRSMAAGDLKGDGTIAIVAGALSSGLWLFERVGDGWTKSLIDANSSGFEHPVYVTDLDGDGKAEIYVGSEDQHELRQYRWERGQFVHTVIAPLAKDDITWNITSGTF